MSDPWGTRPEGEPGERPAWGQPSTPPPGPPPGSPYGEPYGQQPSPYGQPQPYGYGQPPYAARPTSGKATTVMVLGISSLVLMFVCGLGFIAAIIALVMAGGAEREIAQSGGTMDGLGQIKAGKIMSWITLGLSALGLVALVLFVVAVSATGTY